ncbi:MAG TPA: polysaccharide deacetylase family protein [Symbiobacteriaceae bacterium]
MNRRWIAAGVLGAVTALAGSVVALDEALGHWDPMGSFGWREVRRDPQPPNPPVEPGEVESGDAGQPVTGPVAEPEGAEEPAEEPAAPPAGTPEEEPAPEAGDLPILPVHRIGTEGREVVITFDDGPSRYTEEILAILREEQVPAAFFWVAGNPRLDLARQLYDQGHQLGSHTVRHVRLTDLSGAAQLAEMQQSLDLLEQAGQVPVRYFRPPYGSYNAETLDAARQMGLQVILWDVDSRDWEAAHDPNQIITNVMNQVRPGSIILLHEREQTVQVLRDLLRELRSAGYTFRLLPGMESAAAPSPQMAPTAPAGTEQGASQAPAGTEPDAPPAAPVPTGTLSPAGEAGAYVRPAVKGQSADRRAADDQDVPEAAAAETTCSPGDSGNTDAEDAPETGGEGPEP